MEELKKIVNDVFLIDLMSSRRERTIVDARKVYSKILRDEGISLESIGKSINKNHATVIHYIKDLHSILSYDKELRDKYIACKNVFIKKRKPISHQIKKDADVYATVIRLTNELQEALDSKGKVLHDFVNYLESYEKTTGHFPNLYDLRKHMIPLFNK
jgi:hypothetical protein